MTQPYSSPAQLQTLENQLDRLTKDLERARERTAAELEKERQAGNRPEALDQIQGRLTALEAAYKASSDKYQADITRMKTELAQVDAQRQAQGRAELEKAKTAARQKWIASGGSPESFEAQWPQMEAQILQKKTMAAITGKERKPILKSL